MSQKFVVWLNEVDKNDIPLVGGKGANLGEMASIGLPVPPAFIVTSQAYFHFLDVNKLRPKIKEYLTNFDLQNPQKLEKVSEQIKKLILHYPVPEEIAKQIIEYYYRLEPKKIFKKDALVAVRSSATAEDLPTASFAGQQETFLNIKGEAAVIEKIRQCWASLFNARAIFYRRENHFDHFKVGIAVPVQKMIQSESSGIMFTIDPVSNDKSKIVIEAIYGLGELIVQGSITPDHYIVDKKNLEILTKEVAEQKIMLVKKGLETKSFKVSVSKKDHQKITDQQIVEIAKFGKKLEQHYYFPQDVEWAIENKKIYIVQTRPITTIKEMTRSDILFEHSENFSLRSKNKTPVLTGIAASAGIATGPVKIIKSAKEIHKVKLGDILVTEMTNPDFVPAMKKVNGIITDKGGRTAHAAIISRELGIPCIVGTKTATKIFKNGDVLTINGGTGEIFRGGIHHVGTQVSRRIPNQVGDDKKIIKTATKLYVNLSDPDKAQEIARLNVDGIGLLRAEFVMAQIGIHPKKIIQEKKQTMFIDKLADYMQTFCEAFNPRPVVYRSSDFKTSEYRNLIGGKEFEPVEENPLLGFRGGYRYLQNPEVFEMELAAIKKVRHKLGLRNLSLMLPFVRTPEELLKIKKLIAGSGLVRSPSFKIWMMVEIPANFLLLEQFIEAGIDGVSIGSNDLTMLILGVDRDNTEVAPIYNEMHPAVIKAIESVIKTCQKNKITSSICGQSVSDFPKMVEKLVSFGITSVSVSQDAIDRTRETLYHAEEKNVKN